MVYVTLTNNSMINSVGHYFLNKMIQLEGYGCFVYFQTEFIIELLVNVTYTICNLLNICTDLMK
jgi:hypothetical protein